MYKGECAGLAFSPDGMHLYIAYQDEGVLLDIYRKDGFPFHAKSLNIKYHKEVGSKLNGNNNGGNNNNNNSKNGGNNNNNNKNGGNNNNNNNGGGNAANTAKARTGS